MTRLCTCCRTPITVPTCRNVRGWFCEYLYQLYFECPHCMSTQIITLWEAPPMASEEAA